MSILARVRFEPHGDDSIRGKVFVNDQQIENVSGISYKADVGMSIPEVTLTLNGNYDVDQMVALDVEIPLNDETEILKGLRLMASLNEDFRDNLLARIEGALIDGYGLTFTQQAEMILTNLAEEQ